jgi:hypothetical protein
MAKRSRLSVLDLITTICLFIGGLVGLYQSLQFPDRSGMWPTFVMVALVLFVGLHLFNLIRLSRNPDKDAPVNPDTMA